MFAGLWLRLPSPLIAGTADLRARLGARDGPIQQTQKSATTHIERVTFTQVLTKTEKRPIYHPRPGAVLAGKLEELNMTSTELARALHVPSNRLYQLIAGKRAMTADTALHLEQWMGVSAGFWMNLPKRFEMDIATEQIGDEIKRTVSARRVTETASGSTYPR